MKKDGKDENRGQRQMVFGSSLFFVFLLTFSHLSTGPPLHPLLSKDCYLIAWLGLTAAHPDFCWMRLKLVQSTLDFNSSSQLVRTSDTRQFGSVKRVVFHLSTVSYLWISHHSLHSWTSNLFWGWIQVNRLRTPISPLSTFRFTIDGHPISLPVPSVTTNSQSGQSGPKWRGS